MQFIIEALNMQETFGMKLIQRTAETTGHVGYPIDPEFLRVSGQIHTDTSLGAQPRGPGEGRQVYRLYCNRGSWGWHGQIGLLRLEAFPGSEEGEEELHFLQVSRDGGEQLGSGFQPNQAVFRLEGHMRCRRDMPVSGEVCSALYDYTNNSTGIIIEDTYLHESVRIYSGAMDVTVSGKTYHRSLPASEWMTEWNLLRLVGRLPFGEDPRRTFCLLEGMTLPKPSAHLIDTGRHVAPDFGGSLYSFSLLGRGIVPFDYWLDSEHRLIGCISGGLGRAYIPEALMIPPVEDFITREFNRERML